MRQNANARLLGTPVPGRNSRRHPAIQWGCYAVVAWLAVPCGLAGERQAVGMVAQSRVVVEGVVSFVQEGEDAELTLQDGSVCLAGRQEPGYDLWVKLVGHAQRYHSPLYVACDPTTRRIKVLLPTDVYNVESVVPAPARDHLEVAFRQSAAVHYLKPSRRNYGEMKRVLEEALHTGQLVLVTDDQRNLEIIDVRFPRPGSGPFETS